MGADLPRVGPRLPQELERFMFETAASEWTLKESVVFLFVAKRVNNWIRPIIYRVFNQARVAKFPDFEGYPSTKIENVGRFARHLLAAHNCEDVDLLLSSCVNVHNLALWYDVDLSERVESIRRLPLTRFSAPIVDITVGELFTPPFPNLTHLEILSLGPHGSWEDCSAVAQLPKLTHLSIPLENGDLASLFLSRCKLLRILIILKATYESYSGGANINGPAVLSHIKDERLVLMLSDFFLASERDWINGANGKVDTWITAELYCVARKNGYLFLASQIWITSPFDWNRALSNQGKEWYSGLALP